MLHDGLLISEINIGFAEDHLKCAMNPRKSSFVDDLKQVDDVT